MEFTTTQEVPFKFFACIRPFVYEQTNTCKKLERDLFRRRNGSTYRLWGGRV